MTQDIPQALGGRSATVADILDKDAPIDDQSRLFDLIKATPHLDWLLLTKRYAESVDHLSELWGNNPWPNVWLVFSAGEQHTLNACAPILAESNAVVGGISWEPALGPIDFTPWADSIDWMIAGDESGDGRRPPRPLDDYRSVRDQCAATGTAFFIKQFVNPYGYGARIHTPELDGRKHVEFPAPRVPCNEAHDALDSKADHKSMSGQDSGYFPYDDALVVIVDGSTELPDIDF